MQIYNITKIIEKVVIDLPKAQGEYSVGDCYCFAGNMYLQNFKNNPTALENFSSSHIDNWFEKLGATEIIRSDIWISLFEKSPLDASSFSEKNAGYQRSLLGFIAGHNDATDMPIKEIKELMLDVMAKLKAAKKRKEPIV